MTDRLISPTPLSSATAPESTAAAPRPDRKPRRALLALGGTALLALLVVFALPRLVAPKVEPGPANAGTAASAEAEPPDPLLSEEQKAAARLDAQRSEEHTSEL